MIHSFPYFSDFIFYYFLEASFTIIPLLFLGYTKYASASGPLYLLCSLPGIFYFIYPYCYSHHFLTCLNDTSARVIFKIFLDIRGWGLTNQNSQGIRREQDQGSYLLPAELGIHLLTAGLWGTSKRGARKANLDKATIEGLQAMLVEQLVGKYYDTLTERSALIMRKMYAHHPIPHLPHSSTLSRHLVSLHISPKHFYHQ